MKRLTTAIATFMFAAGAGAADLYQGFGAGNPDLGSVAFNADEVTGIQPGVGDSIDRYQGVANGNPDLFKKFDATVTDHEAPNIYHGVSDNPDL